jgi:anti-sigma B factor antagonist
MLNIRQVSDYGGQLVVAATGQVDLATAPELAAVLAQARRDRPFEIVVDLTAVDFLDSAGVRVLVEAARQAAELGVELSVRGAGGWVARVLEITGVDRFVRIVPSEPAGSGETER